MGAPVELLNPGHFEGEVISVSHGHMFNPDPLGKEQLDNVSTTQVTLKIITSYTTEHANPRNVVESEIKQGTEISVYILQGKQIVIGDTMIGQTLDRTDYVPVIHRYRILKPDLKAKEFSGQVMTLCQSYTYLKLEEQQEEINHLAKQSDSLMPALTTSLTQYIDEITMLAVTDMVFSGPESEQEFYENLRQWRNHLYRELFFYWAIADQQQFQQELKSYLGEFYTSSGGYLDKFAEDCSLTNDTLFYLLVEADKYLDEYLTEK